MKIIYWENFIKNIIILIFLFFAYFNIHDIIYNSNIGIEKTSIGNLLVAIGILGVAACFGNFAFTYEKIKHENRVSRILAHITTGLLMLTIGISLEMTSVLTSLLISNFQIFNLSLIIIYIASILYDFWDLQRTDVV